MKYIHTIKRNGKVWATPITGDLTTADQAHDLAAAWLKILPELAGEADWSVGFERIVEQGEPA